MFTKFNEKIINEVIINVTAKSFATLYPTWKAKGDDDSYLGLITVTIRHGRKLTEYNLDAHVGKDDRASYLSISELGCDPLAKFDMSRFIDPEIAFEVAKASLLRLAA